MKYRVNEKGEIVKDSEYDKGEVIPMGEAPYDYEFDDGMGLDFSNLIGGAVKTVSSTTGDLLSKVGDITGITKLTDKYISEGTKSKLAAATAKAEATANMAATKSTLNQLEKVKAQIAATKAGQTVIEKVPGAEKIIGPVPQDQIPPQGDPAAEEAARQAAEAEAAAKQAEADEAQANLLNAKSEEERKAAEAELAKAMKELNDAQAKKMLEQIDTMPEPRRTEILNALKAQGYDVDKYKRKTWLWIALGGLSIAGIATFIVMKKKKKGGKSLGTPKKKIEKKQKAIKSLVGAK